MKTGHCPLKTISLYCSCGKALSPSKNQNKSTCLPTTLKLQPTSAPTSYISILAVTRRRTKHHARARRWGDALDTGRRRFHTVNDATNVVNGMCSHAISTSVESTDGTLQSPLRGLSHGHAMWLVLFLFSSENAPIAARILMLNLVRT